MSTTTVYTILDGAIDSLAGMFSTYLPVILPVAIAVAGLFYVIYWIRGAAHRR